jgi:hypothetical protein
MRAGFICVLVLGLSILAFAQQTAAPAQQVPSPSAQPITAPNSFAEDLKAPALSPEAELKQMFELKIEAEWEALKNRNKKAYGDLLADDYEGIEVDGRGERTKIQAVNELVDSNVFNYSLWGFKLIPLGADADLAVYEVTMQFPPKSLVRYSRLYISELWIKRLGEWKIVHYQETHVK